MNRRWVAAAAVALITVTLAVRVLRAPEVSTVGLENRDVVRTLVLVGRVRPPSRAGLAAVAEAEAGAAAAAAQARSAVQMAETEALQADRDLERIRAVF